MGENQQCFEEKTKSNLGEVLYLHNNPEVGMVLIILQIIQVFDVSAGHSIHTSYVLFWWKYVVKSGLGLETRPLLL
jgi:hypothetical protein